MVLDLLKNESIKQCKNKKVWFAEDVKQPLEAGLMCTNTWIRDSGESCHITNDDTGLYDIIDIDESIQGSSSIMPAMKKEKLQLKVCQVDGTEQIHTLWTVKCCSEAGANLFSLTCKLLHGNKIVSDH